MADVNGRRAKVATCLKLLLSIMQDDAALIADNSADR